MFLTARQEPRRPSARRTTGGTSVAAAARLAFGAARCPAGDGRTRPQRTLTHPRAKEMDFPIRTPTAQVRHAAPRGEPHQGQNRRLPKGSHWDCLLCRAFTINSRTITVETTLVQTLSRLADSLGLARDAAGSAGCGVLGEAVFFARSSPTGTASPRTPQPWHAPRCCGVQKKPGRPAVINYDAAALDAALRDVVDAIGDVQTRLAGHGERSTSDGAIRGQALRNFGIGRRVTVTVHKPHSGQFRIPEVPDPGFVHSRQLKWLTLALSMGVVSTSLTDRPQTPRPSQRFRTCHPATRR